MKVQYKTLMSFKQTFFKRYIQHNSVNDSYYVAAGRNGAQLPKIVVIIKRPLLHII
jgi:hypothetical protein